MSDNEVKIGLEDINHFELILFAVEKAHQMQMTQKKINKNMPKTNILALEAVKNNPSVLSELKSSLMRRCVLGNQEFTELNNEEEFQGDMLEELQTSDFMIGVEEKISEKDSIIIGPEEDLL